MELLLVLLAVVIVAALIVLALVWLVWSSNRPADGDTPDEDVAPGAQRAAPRGGESRAAGPPPPSKSSKYLSEEEAAYYLVRDGAGRLPVRVAGGFFVHDGTRKRVSPGNRALSRAGARSFNVRGSAYYPEDGLAADTSPGTRVRFRREPENEYDPNAVAVLALDADGQKRRVGYVNKGNARALSKRLVAGEKINARFMRGAPAGVEPEGIAVVEVSAEDMKRLFRR